MSASCEGCVPEGWKKWEGQCKVQQVGVAVIAPRWGASSRSCTRACGKERAGRWLPSHEGVCRERAGGEQARCCSWWEGQVQLIEPARPGGTAALRRRR